MTELISTECAKSHFLATIKTRSFTVKDLNGFFHDNIDTLRLFGCNYNIYNVSDKKYLIKLRALISAKVISKPTKQSSKDARVKLYTYRNIIELMVCNRYLSHTISKPQLENHIIKLSNAEILERLYSVTLADSVTMIKKTLLKRKRENRKQVLKVKKTGTNIIEPTPAPIETPTPAKFVAIDTTQPLELQLKSLIEKIKMHGTTTTLIDLEYILASRKQMLSNL